MEYGRLIREAWQITWRHPFLWVLGLFAGGTAGASLGGGGSGDAEPALNGWQGEPGAFSVPIPGVDRTMPDLGSWAANHVGLIAAIVALTVLAGLVLLVISLIAQGGLAGATADLASGRSSSLRDALRTGAHLFWRYAGLWLLLATTVAIIGAVIAAFVALVAVLSMAVENTAWVIAPALLVGMLLIVSGIAAGVVASVVVPYAQRAIAVLDIGPLAALREGWRVLRAHPGASLLVWLLNVALTFGAGLVVTAVMLVVVVALATPLVALWLAIQLSGPTALAVSIVYVSIAVCAAIGVLLTLVSVINTFFWSYWTLAYLRLRSEPTAGAGH
jgi:hypothetical protein